MKKNILPIKIFSTVELQFSDFSFTRGIFNCWYEITILNDFTAILQGRVTGELLYILSSCNYRL